jgi:hypothetical protein
MTPNGYIPIPRSFFQDPLWKERRTFTKAEALADLYQRAAYAPHKKLVDGKLVEVRMGEVVDSLRYLAEAWGWAKSTVSDFLKKLQTLEIVTLETRTGINAITLTFSATYYAEMEKARTATGQQPDSNRTAAGQQPDKEEEDKENKEDKEGKVEASPAPPHNSQFTVPNSQFTVPTKPGTTEFTLLQRIGKPAAQIWTQGSAADHFDTPGHAALALDWMEHLCRKQRPLQSQQELSALIAQFKGKHLDELKAIAQYSYTGGYTALYFDRLAKNTKKQNQPHKAEVIHKNRFEADRQKAAPNGLIKFD